MSRVRVYIIPNIFPVDGMSGHAVMNLEFQSRTIPRRTKYTTIWYPDEIKDLARRSRASAQMDNGRVKYHLSSKNHCSVSSSYNND